MTVRSMRMANYKQSDYSRGKFIPKSFVAEVLTCVLEYPRNKKICLAVLNFHFLKNQSVTPAIIGAFFLKRTSSRSGNLQSAFHKKFQKTYNPKLNGIFSAQFHRLSRGALEKTYIFKAV
jgi:hypothetical protein